jgi:hypothetical protein
MLFQYDMVVFRAIMDTCILTESDHFLFYVAFTGKGLQFRLFQIFFTFSGDEYLNHLPWMLGDFNAAW